MIIGLLMCISTPCQVLYDSITEPACAATVARYGARCSARSAASSPVTGPPVTPSAVPPSPR